MWVCVRDAPHTAMRFSACRCHPGVKHPASAQQPLFRGLQNPGALGRDTWTKTLTNRELQPGGSPSDVLTWRKMERDAIILKKQTGEHCAEHDRISVQTEPKEILCAFLCLQAQGEVQKNKYQTFHRGSSRRAGREERHVHFQHFPN